MPNLPLKLHEGSLPEGLAFKSKSLLSKSLLYFGGLMTMVEANGSLAEQNLTLILIPQVSRCCPFSILIDKAIVH